jgi:hypothetical protein
MAAEEVDSTMANIVKEGIFARHQQEDEVHSYLIERLFNQGAIDGLVAHLRTGQLPLFNSVDTRLTLENALRFVQGGGGGLTPDQRAQIDAVMNGLELNDINIQARLQDPALPLYTTYRQPISAAELATIEPNTMRATTLLTFHVHVQSEHRVIVHLITTSTSPFTYIMDPFTQPEVDLLRHNGDIHYFLKKLANEIFELSRLNPLSIGANFTVSYDVMFNRSIDERGGMYHRDISEDGTPYDYLSLEYFMPDEVACMSAELIASYPRVPGGNLIPTEEVRTFFRENNEQGQRVNLRVLVVNGSVILFDNVFNIHATPSFGPNYRQPEPSYALGNETRYYNRTSDGTLVSNTPPVSRAEHDRPTLMSQVMPDSPDYLPDAFETPVDDPQGFIADTSTRVGPYVAFGSGFDRQAVEPSPPIPPGAAEMEVDQSDPNGPNPAGCYPAYKNDEGTTIQFELPIAVPRDHLRRITRDITTNLESDFVQTSALSEMERYISNTLTIRRSFIRGSWKSAEQIEVLRGTGIRALLMRSGWIYVEDLQNIRMDDTRHTVGGGKNQLKLPNSIFSNVMVNVNVPLLSIKRSEVDNYLKLEENFKRAMKGGKKQRKINKKTKKRSKKQTRKRGKIMKNRMKTFSRG